MYHCHCFLLGNRSLFVSAITFGVVVVAIFSYSVVLYLAYFYNYIENLTYSSSNSFSPPLPLSSSPLSHSHLAPPPHHRSQPQAPPSALPTVTSSPPAPSSTRGAATSRRRTHELAPSTSRRLCTPQGSRCWLPRGRSRTSSGAAWEGREATSTLRRGR